MASGHNDPKLLYAVNGVSAYHMANGHEESLTPAGPQTLSLLMVPTSSQFASDSAADQTGADPQEEDFYLHLHLPPELDLPLPATTQIYHQPPTSYLIPRWDLGPDSGAFTRIEFPPLGDRKGVQDDVDTFETILAQCTAFLERAQPPTTQRTLEKTRDRSAQSGGGGAGGSSSAKAKEAAGEQLPAYDPGNYKPGEAYVAGSHSSINQGQIVLVNEEDGSVVGELGEGFQIVESNAVQAGSKEPVQITLPADGQNQIAIAPAAPEDIEMILHPAYKKSFIVSNAAAASRLIVTTSDMLSKALQSQADSFTQKSAPTNKPVTFNPTAQQHIRRLHTLTANAAGLSAKTVGHIGKVAQNVGATLGRHKKQSNVSGGSSKGFDADGNPDDGFKPGILNKSMMAFLTVADGIEAASKNILNSSSSAATQVVGHKWGPDAGDATAHLTGGVKNVALVYIDVTGVSRRAVLKSVAKGMVIGRVANGGGDVIVGGGDGGVITMQGASGPGPKLPQTGDVETIYGDDESVYDRHGGKQAQKY